MICRFASLSATTTSSGSWISSVMSSGSFAISRSTQLMTSTINSYLNRSSWSLTSTLIFTYLPDASASALKDILRIVYRSDKPVRITPMSELNVADLRDSHIIYIGYISALDKLMEFVFASSGLQLGDTYDELSRDSRVAENVYERRRESHARTARITETMVCSRRFPGPRRQSGHDHCGYPR